MGKRIWMVLFLAMGICFLFGNRAEAAVNPDGSVAINEENFPDERFRYLASSYDADRDSVLTLEERSVLEELTLIYRTYHNSDWPGIYCEIYQDEFKKDKVVTMKWRKKEGDTSPLSVKGIEYFPNLCRYVVNGYMETKGSLKNNPKLTEICIETEEIHTGVMGWVWPCKLEDCSRLEEEFPLKQVKKLEIGPAFECKNFSLKSAKALEELSIGITSFNRTYKMVETSVLGKADLSACKKLKKLCFHGVKINKLDLRKNTELRELEFGGRVSFHYDGDEPGAVYPAEYPLQIDRETFRCTLKLPPNNQIKKMVWMSDSRKLDLTSCRKLTFLQVPGGRDISFNKKWYQSYGKKNLALYIWGTKAKKKVRKKASGTVWIKTQNRFWLYDQPAYALM